MAPKGMKVVVQKKGKTTVVQKKSAASSMTALTEWAKGKSDDEMDTELDDDTDDSESVRLRAVVASDEAKAEERIRLAALKSETASINA